MSADRMATAAQRWSYTVQHWNTADDDARETEGPILGLGLII